jgi:diphthine synthase
MTHGTLSFVGLGLYDEQDISVKGLNAVKNAEKVYAEFYTADLMGVSLDVLEDTFEKKIHVLSREETEKGSYILQDAKKGSVAFLVCGDPMIATTHIDLRLQAVQQGIKTRIIHNSSIIGAAPGLLGLQQYKFGRTTTIAYPEKNYFPTSPYKVIQDNHTMGLHTLILLDIQADKNRYMTANEGIEYLCKMEELEKKNLILEDTILCVVARAGSDDALVKADTIAALKKGDYGKPLHCLVLPGHLHFMEVEALEKIAGLPSECSKKIQKL